MSTSRTALSPQDASQLGLSVVVPLLDEFESIPELYRELTQACEGVGRPYELIFVDDGSVDGSSNRLDEYAAADSRVTVIHFRRNFGKSSGLAAGFACATGDIVITLDADLQDDPAMIPQFIEQIEGGADLVSGWKRRRHDSIDKTIPSRLFNFVVRRLSGVPLHDFNCGFKAYRSDCVHELRVYGSLHRFLPVLAAARGYRVEQMVVNHRPRKHGRSKFGSRRLVAGVFDLLTVLFVTRFRTRPLHFFGLPGLVLGTAGFGILSYLTVLWLQGEPIGSRPLLMLGVLLSLTAGQLICVGLLGELLVRNTSQIAESFSVRSIEQQPRRVRPVAGSEAIAKAPTLSRGASESLAGGASRSPDP